MTYTTSFSRRLLKSGTAISALVILGAGCIASPAMAQDASNLPGTQSTGSDQSTAAAPTPGSDQASVPTNNANEGAAGEEIVVTGTLFRRTNSETPSPVTVLSAESLAQRGITNVADAVRSISADNSGSIPTAFAGGFGSGSAGVSLRGLTVNSTLVVIDGIRTVNYPYADDGQRSFVDLNSIPQSIIDRVEVLKDGASSTYGADAIGGVVNIIIKKEITGISGTAEAGISQRGDGGEQRLTLTAGYGDLSSQGFNVYVNGEYEHDGYIGVNQRGFPYNAQDLTPIGGDDNNYGAGGAFGLRYGTFSAVVQQAREATPGDVFSGVILDANLPTLILNPAGCGVGTIEVHDATGGYCEQNVAPFNTIQPRQTRWGVTGHLTANVGAQAQAYLTASYYRSEVFSSGSPQSVRQQNPINTRNLVLPAILSDGSLNPNDPYAVAGCVEGVSCIDAQLAFAFNIPQTFNSTNQVYRVAGGIAGSFGEGWTYSLDATYAKSSLEGVNKGYINVNGLRHAVADGTFDFIHPEQNSQALLDTISFPVTTRARGELYMAQGVVTKELLDLAGGPLQLGIGGSIRHESLNNPNANANQEFLGLNAVTAAGHHTVQSAFFEVNAPLLTSLEVNASGRYDHYSDGYSHFSPKVGFKFTPIRQLAIRGTFSKGFRAPTFAEKNQGAVIGYTAATPPCSVILAHGGTGNLTTCAGGSAYVNAYAIGFNSASNPNIKPELSTSYTAGLVFQPLTWLSMTVDYYNIKKTRVIAGGPESGTAIANYYAGLPLPAGYTLTLDDPDPLFPAAIRKILIVNSPYANASALKTSGLDVAVLAQFKPSPGLKFSSQIEVTDIFNYDFKPAAGNPYDHYVGTQAPYILSSGAGTPKWRGNWQNTLEAGSLTLSGTAYYTSGYKAVAEDYNGHGHTACTDNLYDPGKPEFYCRTKGFIDVDFVASYKVSPEFTFYVNVINAFDAKAPLNPANYAGFNYNPTWSQQGIVGRFFRAGVNVKL